MATVSMTVNGQSVTADVDPAHPAGPVPAREPAPHRHPCGLRHQPVRRLRVHLNGQAVKSCTILAAPGEGQRRHHDRGHRRRRPSCTRCRRPSASITACNAATARRA